MLVNSTQQGFLCHQYYLKISASLKAVDIDIQIMLFFENKKLANFHQKKKPDFVNK